MPFEVLSGDNGTASQRDLVVSLAHFVGIPIKEEQADAALMAVIGKETKTWSGKRSTLEEYWSSESEQWFVKAGGRELNRLLGYD